MTGTWHFLTHSLHPLVLIASAVFAIALLAMLTKTLRTKSQPGDGGCCRSSTKQKTVGEGKS